MTGATRTELKILAVLAAVGVISLAAAYFIGISLCPVYNLIGIPCPSCGMTRAWISALRGDFVQAFIYHPMFWLVALLPFLSRLKHMKALALIMIILLMVVWAARMFFLFPHTEPMTVNEQAAVLRVWK